jgi:hypothetical protein
MQPFSLEKAQTKIRVKTFFSFPPRLDAGSNEAFGIQHNPEIDNGSPRSTDDRN